MFDLILAIDTEFVRDGTKNRVLCYSFACVNPARPEDVVTHVFHLDKGMRWTLSGLLARIIAELLAQEFINRPPPKPRRSKGNPVVDHGRLKILLVAHFSRADLPAFADWKKLKRSFDAVRGTYTTTRNAEVVTLYPPGRARLAASVTLADTMLLAPNGYQSLRDLGDSLGFEKQDVGEYITRMDQLQAEDRARFEAYAIRDAEVCLTWVLTFLEFWENDLGFVGKKLPPTIGSAAMQYALKIWESQGIKAGNVCGYTGSGSNRHWIDALRAHIPFLADCYHGGRNEAFWVGPTGAPTEIVDIDIVSAYTTAMCAIRMPAWEECYATTDLTRLAVIDTHMTFARVRFQFPPDTRYPCLPVRTRDNGLVYPLTGTTHVAGPELALALVMGATIEVITGLVIPWRSDSDYRPFLGFTQKIRELRKKHPKKSPSERLAKEAGNSLYGKTGQGVQNLRPSGDAGIDANARQRAFNTREGRMEDLSPSRVTSPALAAYTTSIVRAVLSELLAGLPPSCTLYTATTDGFLSTAELQDVRQDGPLCQFFRGLRELVDGPGAPMLEIKHRVTAGIVMKTRGFIATAGEGPCLLARAGMRLSKPSQDVWEEARAWEAQYRTRTYGITNKSRTLIPLREQWLQNADLLDEERTVTLNLETDMKRQLINLREVGGVIAAGTAPWPDIDAFHEARGLFDEWRKSRRRVLRDLEDYRDYVSWVKDRPAYKRINARNTGQITPGARFLARAWARRAFGCPGGHYAEVAALFTDNGFPFTANAFKQMTKGRKPLASCPTLSERERPLIDGLLTLGAAYEFMRCLNYPPHMHLRHPVQEEVKPLTLQTSAEPVTMGLPDDRCLNFRPTNFEHSLVRDSSDPYQITNVEINRPIHSSRPVLTTRRTTDEYAKYRPCRKAPSQDG